MNFADLKYCRIKKDRKSKYCVRYRPFGIEKYFSSKVEAIEFQTQLVLSLNMLDRVLPMLTATDFTGRLSKADYDIILSQEENLLPDIANKIAFVPKEFADVKDLLSGPNAKNVTVAEAVTLYCRMKEEQGKPISSSLMFRFTCWKTSLIGQMRPSEVKPDMIAIALKRLKEENNWAPATRNRAKQQLSSVWTFIVETLEADDKYTPRYVRDLDVDENHTEPYTKEEVAIAIKIARDADAEAVSVQANTFRLLGPIVELYSLTGIRNKFLAALRWDEVHITSHPYISKEMKSNKYRRVPLRPRAVEILQELYETRSSDTWVFPSPFDANTYAVRWDRRFKTKLKEAADRGEIRYLDKPIHAFRSYIATQLAELGMSAIIIADWIGVTERVAQGYIKRTHRLSDIAIEALDGVGALERNRMHSIVQSVHRH